MGLCFGQDTYVSQCLSHQEVKMGEKDYFFEVSNSKGEHRCFGRKRVHAICANRVN